MTEHEWDWPPTRQRAAPEIEGRIEREEVVFVRPKRAPVGRSGRVEAAIADRFLKGIWLLWKIAFGAILGLLLFGCAWLIGAILRS